MHRTEPSRPIRRHAWIAALLLSSLPILAEPAVSAVASIGPAVAADNGDPAEPAAPGGSGLAEDDTGGPVDPPKRDATSPNNPYRSIVARNAFRLREPAPPPPPPTNAPVAAEPPKLDVKIEGFGQIAGVRWAYLLVPDLDKPGQFLHPALTDNPDKGQVRHRSGLEVREIDLKKKAVRVINGGIEATLTMKDNGVKKDAAAAAAPGKPGGPIPPPGGAAGNVGRAGTTTTVFPAGGGAVPQPAAPASSGGGEPVVFSRNANRASANTGNPVAAQAIGGAAVPISGISGIGNTTGSMPTRPQRIDTTVVPSIPVEHQYDVLLRQREAAASVGVQLPPIPGMPAPAPHQ